MRDGSLVVMLLIAGMIGATTALERNGVDVRMAIVSAAEWVTGQEARY